MLSFSIVTSKPVVRLPGVLVPHRTPQGVNKSFITNDGVLEAFLDTCPKEGTWVWRRQMPGYEIETKLTEQSQLQYVVRVIRSLGHLEMTYDRTSGFPMTHEIITSCAYTTGDHYRRFVDIRDFEQVNDEQYKRFVSDKLQNYIQSVIAPGT